MVVAVDSAAAVVTTVSFRLLGTVETQLRPEKKKEKKKTLKRLTLTGVPSFVGGNNTRSVPEINAWTVPFC